VQSKPSLSSVEPGRRMLCLLEVNSTWKVIVSVLRMGAVSVLVSSRYDRPVSSSVQVRFSISHLSSALALVVPLVAFALGMVASRL